jgi:hypothetical protein
MFLTAEEIVRMTGAKTRPAQAAWLNEHGIPFTVSRRAELNVLWAAVARRHGADGDPAGTVEPDFSVFERGVHSRRHAAKTTL